MYIFHQTGYGLSHAPISANAYPLSGEQKQIVATLWITYALYYLGRVNISVVLPALAIALGASRAEVGALGTVFFWVYGIGNFINGELGSHISPFRIVSFGLITIALVNIAFAFQTSLIIMLILWGINGFAQSTGWAPMFRILAERLEQVQIKRVSTIMPFSYVIGTAITWTFVGVIATDSNWQVAFWLPGALVMGVFIFWWRTGIDAPPRQSNGFRLQDITSEFRNIWFALVSAGLSGFVLVGTIIWLPTYIADTGLIPTNLVGFFSAILQVIAVIGLLIARWMVIRTSSVFMTTVILFIVTAVSFLGMLITTGFVALVNVAVALIALNGAFGMIVSSIPLILATDGRASSVTGSINMMSNFWGGLAGITVGALVESNGWQSVFALWAVLLLMSSLLIWLKRDEEGKKRRNEQ